LHYILVELELGGGNGDSTNVFEGEGTVLRSKPMPSYKPFLKENKKPFISMFLP